METGPLIPVFWFFVLSFAACATLYLAVDRGGRPVQRRLREVATKFRLSEGRYDEENVVDRGLADSVLQWAQRRMPAPNLEKPAVAKLVSLIQYAGFYNPAAPTIFQIIRLAVTVGGALLGYVTAAVVGSSPLIFIAAGAAVGYLAPLYSVRALAKSRQRKIRREIVDVIDLLVVCVECGLGLLASIRIVGRECERQGRIMGAQLGTLSAELAAGASLGEGLRAIAQRTGVDEIKPFRPS
jgi:tight adherence protein C